MSPLVENKYDEEEIIGLKSSQPVEENDEGWSNTKSRTGNKRANNLVLFLFIVGTLMIGKKIYPLSQVHFENGTDAKSKSNE